MMEGWMLDMLGHSEFALRFISAIAGVIAVMMSYFVTVKLFKKWQFGILVASLFLISTYCLEYSQEARGYELVLMLFLCQLYVFLYAMETKKIIFWVLLAVFSAVSFAMQYIAGLATLTLFLYAFYATYGDIKQKDYSRIIGIVVSLAIILVLTYPLWDFTIAAITKNGSNEHWAWCKQGLLYAGDTIYRFLSRISVIAIAMFILMVLGILHCRKEHREEYKLLLWIMLFPLILTTILSIFMNFTPRYIIWSLPPYLIFVAMSFYYFGTDKETLKRANTVAVVAVVLVACISLPLYYTEPTKADYRGAAQVISTNAEEGDILVYCPNSVNSIYATLSFYWVPEEHGVKAVGYESEQQIIDLSRSPDYGKVFILTDEWQPGFAFFEKSKSPTFQEIMDGHMINVFMITEPM